MTVFLKEDIFLKQVFKIILSVFVFSFCVIAVIIQKEKTPLISVIMSTYNRDQLISKAITSILNQTVSDFEFIIVNDGSTDKTADILKNFARQDSRIKLIENGKNLGLIPSLNKALSVARGTYIARMDDDDFSLPVRFERQIEFMKRNPDVTVTGTTPHVYATNPPKKQPSTVFIEADAAQCYIESYYQVPILHPSAMIRRDFLVQHNIFYDKRYPSAEDIDFWHQIALAGGNIVRLTPPLVLRGNSVKKKGYYSEQISSYNAYLNESLNAVKQGYIFSQSWINKKETCFILDRLEKIETIAARKTAIDKLKKQEACSSDSFFAVRHNTRSLLFEEKENDIVCAAEDNCFHVIQKDDETLLIESEITHKQYLYRRLAGIWISDNTFFSSSKIIHPHWRDSFFVFGTEVLFSKKKNRPRLISWHDTDLTLKWEDNKEETFVKNTDGTYIFQK